MHVDTKLVRYANSARDLTADGGGMLLATYDSIRDVDVGRTLGGRDTKVIHVPLSNAGSHLRGDTCMRTCCGYLGARRFLHVFNIYIL
jgi:hypothetical protein